MLLALSVEEVGEFEQCESVVGRGLETFIEVGTALLKIRDRRLYRQTFDTFEDYCRVRWGMVRRQADRLISAAEVAGNLRPIGLIPDTESQARPLARLEPEQQREAMQRAVESAPNGKPTARQVEAAAEAVAPRDEPEVRPLPNQPALWPDDEDEQADIEAGPETDEPADEDGLGDGQGEDDDVEDEDGSAIETRDDGRRESKETATLPSVPTLAPAIPAPPGFAKLWDYVDQFMISLPRRGGMASLLRDYPDSVISGTHGQMQSLRETIDGAIDELEEAYPWLKQTQT